MLVHLIVNFVLQLYHDNHRNLTLFQPCVTNDACGSHTAAELQTWSQRCHVRYMGR